VADRKALALERTLHKPRERRIVVDVENPDGSVVRHD
jgi:hypothetical protein